MRLQRLGLILFVSLLGSVSPPLLLDFPIIFSASPALAQNAGSLKAEADRLFKQGSEQLQLSQFREASQSWQKALTIYQQISNRPGEARSLEHLGLAHRRLGKYQEAIDFHQQSLAIKQKLNDRQGQAYSLDSLGLAYRNLKEYQKAIDFLEKSLAIKQELNDRQGEADSLGYLGLTYHSLGQYQKAIDSLQQFLKIAQEFNYRQGEANSLSHLGDVYLSQGQYQKAIDYHQQSLVIKRELNNRYGEANSLDNLGVAHLLLGQYQEAINFHQQSLAIKRDLKDRQGEANSLDNLGVAYSKLAQYQKAIDFYQQSLAIAKEINYRQGVANSLGNLADAYRNQGQLSQADELHQQSLTIKRELGDYQGEAHSLNTQGDVYLSLGQYQKAIDLYQQSLEMARERNDRQGEANALGNLGVAYSSLGQYPKAIDFLEKSLVIKRKLNDRQGEAHSLDNLGVIYRNQEQYQKAIDFHQQSLVIKQELNDRRGEVHSLSNLGFAYFSLRQYKKAIDFHQQSLVIAQEINDREGKGNALNNLGAALFKSGNLKAAETTLRQGMKVLESLRIGLTDDQKVSIFDTQSQNYQTLQQVLVARNKPDAALEIAERGRTRALAELLAKGLSSTSETPLTYPTLEEIKQIAQQQNVTLVEYSIVFDAELYIWVIPPTGKIEFRRVNLSEDTSLEDLVKNGRACILQDKCRSNNNRTIPTIGDWVKLNDDEFEEPWQVVNIQQDTLTLRLESWEKGITIQRPINDVVAVVNAFNRKRLQQLHQLLIQPIANLLPKNENERVIFIPHQQLFFVSFPALQDEDGNYLIEKHTILTAPSIEVLGLTSKKRKRQQLTNSVQGALVAGNPTMPSVITTEGEAPKPLSDLPHAGTEAIEIAQLLNTQALTGNSATKVAILPKLPQARIIHLATHGLLDDIKGLGIPGAIALAPSGTGKLNDGLLTAGEIFKMKLNAELVVLSACKTGQGRITGDGVIGLSRSLVAAGVPSIIVSMWSVPDAPTADLMTRFYQNFDRSNDKAQALRQAMLNTMEEHSNPRDWAAFTLIGEAL